MCVLHTDLLGISSKQFYEIGFQKICCTTVSVSYPVIAKGYPYHPTPTGQYSPKWRYLLQPDAIKEKKESTVRFSVFPTVLEQTQYCTQESD